MSSEKRRSSRIGFGSPPFKHLYVRPVHHNFQENLLMLTIYIVALFWKLKGLEETLSQGMSTLLTYLKTRQDYLVKILWYENGKI